MPPYVSIFPTRLWFTEVRSLVLFVILSAVTRKGLAQPHAKSVSGSRLKEGGSLMSSGVRKKNVNR